MRTVQFWWRTLFFSALYNPAWFIDLLMTVLAMLLLGRWEVTKQWPYLVLSCSYAIGAAMSMWVQATVTPLHAPRMMKVLALLLLIYSFYGFAELTPYLR